MTTLKQYITLCALLACLPFTKMNATENPLGQPDCAYLAFKSHSAAR